MNTWVLVIYIYAGAMAKGDSVTLTSIPGFKSYGQCVKAGTDSKTLVANSYKEQRYVCLAQDK
jgi:hypothetical protein